MPDATGRVLVSVIATSGVRPVITASCIAARLTRLSGPASSPAAKRAGDGQRITARSFYHQIVADIGKRGEAVEQMIAALIPAQHVQIKVELSGREFGDHGACLHRAVRHEKDYLRLMAE